MIVQENGKWFVKRDGKAIGGPYDTEAEAVEREKGVQAFAHKADGAEVLAGVHRVDRGVLKKPEKLANGWLRADAHLTRTGVFIYRDASGKERREYRPPSEVFKADALKSFRHVPLTDEHPPGYLHAKNTRQYSRGAVGEVREDGKFVAGELLVTDADLVTKLESGEARQVSCGYRCDLELTSGVSPEGERFDAIQRDIVGNHLAVVKVGRAGALAAVRMDASDLAVLFDQESGGADPASASSPTRNDEGTVKHTIKIGGISFEVEDAKIVQALEKHDAEHAAELVKANDLTKAAVEKLDKLQAKFDSEVDAHGKTKEELKTAPEKIRTEAKARLELEGKARKVLGAKVKLDGLKLREVQEKVIAKLSPKLDLEGKSDTYVEARFDGAIEDFESREDGDEPEDGDEDEREQKPSARLREVTNDADEEDDEREDEDDEGSDRSDSQSAFDRMKKANDELWKKPLDGRREAEE